MLARPVTFPPMDFVMIHFVMERMVDLEHINSSNYLSKLHSSPSYMRNHVYRNTCPSQLINPMHMRTKFWAMSIVFSVPISHEQVRVNHLVLSNINQNHSKHCRNQNTTSNNMMQLPTTFQRDPSSVSISVKVPTKLFHIIRPFHYNDINPHITSFFYSI